MKKIKTRAANLPVPQSRPEAAEFLREIGDLNRALLRAEADMNDELARIKERHVAATMGLIESRDALLDGLRTWCEANREALTSGGKTKSADLGTGLVLWRLAPPKVTIRKMEDVIERLKSAGLAHFLRTKTEIDKEAMLRAPDEARAIPGVSIGSAGEDFAVEPFETTIEGAAA